MRISVILIVLVLAAGCASSSNKSSDKSAPPRRPGMDTLCYDDCLGAGTSKEFCEQRCSY